MDEETVRDTLQTLPARNGYGMLNTHWRTGCSGHTSSTSNAALSVIRRAPQLGQKPRRLQLNATRCSAWQLSHWEAVLEAAAREVFLELALDIPRQLGALRCTVCLERRIIFPNE